MLELKYYLKKYSVINSNFIVDFFNLYNYETQQQEKNKKM